MFQYLAFRVWPGLLRQRARTADVLARAISCALGLIHQYPHRVATGLAYNRQGFGVMSSNNKVAPLPGSVDTGAFIKSGATLPSSPVDRPGKLDPLPNITGSATQQPLLKAPFYGEPRVGEPPFALTDPSASKASVDRPPLTAETVGAADASAASQDAEEEERVRRSWWHAWALTLACMHGPLLGLISMQNLDNYIPFRLAYIIDSMVKDFPEVRRRTPSIRS